MKTSEHKGAVMHIYNAQKEETDFYVISGQS